MKLCLIFLTTCLVATTFGQNLFYWPFSYGNAAANPRSGGQYWPARPYHQEPYGEDDDQYEDEDVFARNKFQLRPSSKRRPDNKFNHQAKFNDYARFLSTRATSTVITTTFGTTSTITTTSVRTCFPAANLAANAPACRRKREASPFILESIEPTSNINQVETTALNNNNEEDRIRREIDSSQDVFAEYLAERQGASPRFGFSILSSILFAPASTTTVVITIPTSISVVSTTSVKTVNLAAAGNLLCSPAGFVTC